MFRDVTFFNQLLFFSNCSSCFLLTSDYTYSDYEYFPICMLLPPQTRLNETSSHDKTVLSQRVGENIWHHIVLYGQFKCNFKPYCEYNQLHLWTYCKRVAKFHPTICETTEGSAEGESCWCCEIKCVRSQTWSNLIQIASKWKKHFIFLAHVSGSASYV